MNLVMRNTLEKVELEELTAKTEKAFDFSEKDDHIIIVVQNSGGESSLTIKAGNGIQGVCDLDLNVPEGISLFKLESGRFKNVSGVNKGKIVVVSTGSISVGTVALI